MTSKHTPESAAEITPNRSRRLAQAVQTSVKALQKTTGTQIGELMLCISQLQTYAVLKGESNTVLTLQECMRDVAKAQELLTAFQKHRTLGGEDGVANALGLTRYGAYLRIKELGANTDVFKDPNATLASVIQQSTKLSQSVADARALVLSYSTSGKKEQ